MSRTRRNHNSDCLRIKDKRKGKDTKPRCKPDSEFKYVKKGIRRAKEKQALKNGLCDIVPIFKKTNEWEYN